MEPTGTIAGTQGIVGEVEAALAAARATIERHEAAAREHSDERAAMHGELARVTGERDAAQAVAANIERERHALREAYDRDTARLRDDLTEARLSNADRQNRYVAGVLADNAVQRAEIERLRGLIPAVAVVVCPACGVDITADLDDDAEYITRRHSRRTTAIGLGEIVWCDGGIARAVSR